MSIQFSDTTTKKGLVQFFEKEVGFEYGDVSNDADMLAAFTADVNEAIDDYVALAIPASGKWQFDDTNHTKYPIITTNLVAGQRDYSFLLDEQNNMILDIYRVYVKDENGTYNLIDPVDRQSGSDVAPMYDGLEVQGVPYRYDKTANGIFLDSVPSYSISAGLKIEIAREGSYFVSSDTTKKPGVPVEHKYFYLKPALKKARINNLASYDKILKEIEDCESKIIRHFGNRARDERPVMRGRQTPFM
jgi:hypothetical protein